jgi:flagellar biosynthesis protein FliR
MTDAWIAALLPFLLVLVRVSAMFVVFPVFSWAAIPVRVRAAVALSITIFFAVILPVPQAARGHVHWVEAVLLMARELITGAGIGLTVGIFYQAVQQGGLLASRQMGFAMAQIVDPMTGQQGRVIDMIFQICFLLLFLITDGHHLLIRLMYLSYKTFPVGELPQLGLLVEGLVQASSAMLVYALRLASPVLAGFFVLSVVLGVLARIAPEMNILMIGFPLRVTLGLMLAAATAGVLDEFVAELTEWVTLFMLS